MITWTRVTQSEDAVTGLVTPVVTTITGSAFGRRPNPQRYASLGLKIATMPTLFFTPTDYPLRAFSEEFVMPGDTTEWAGQTFTAKDIDPIAPDGFVVGAYIIIGI